MVEEHDIVGGLFSESSMCSASDDRSIASYIMVDYGAPAKNLGEYRMKSHHTRGINKPGNFKTCHMRNGAPKNSFLATAA